MEQVKFTNEKGNPIPTMRAEMYQQAMTALIKQITSAEKGLLKETIVNADSKGISVPLAVDIGTGATVYLRGEFTVSTKDPSAVAEKKKSSKPKSIIIEIPDLFE